MFNNKMNEQFQDFILKVDGELTRRNRLRIETKTRFDSIEDLIRGMNQKQVGIGESQNLILGSIKKLMYTNDIQTAINIQDELDKEWVSLFAGLNEKSGQYNHPSVHQNPG